MGKSYSDMMMEVLHYEVDRYDNKCENCINFAKHPDGNVYCAKQSYHLMRDPKNCYQYKKKSKKSGE